MEEAKDALAQAMSALRKDDHFVRNVVDEKLPQTDLPATIRELVKILLPHFDRLTSFCDSVAPVNGWSLTAAYNNDSGKRHPFVCLCAQKPGEDQIRLSYSHQTITDGLPKPSGVLGAVQALSTLPAVLLAWQADTQKDKKEATKKRSDTAKALTQAENELRQLCAKIIEVSTRILGAEPSGQQTNNQNTEETKK